MNITVRIPFAPGQRYSEDVADKMVGTTTVFKRSPHERGMTVLIVAAKIFPDGSGINVTIELPDAVAQAYGLVETAGINTW